MSGQVVVFEIKPITEVLTSKKILLPSTLVVTTEHSLPEFNAVGLTVIFWVPDTSAITGRNQLTPKLEFL